MTQTWIAAAALALWIYLALSRGGFWRASERLTPCPEPKNWPEVVAVIPARDEADTIGDVISAHLTNNYPGKYSLILVDDQSSDMTGDVARKAAQNCDPNALHIITSEDLPDGWSGKLWAVHQGLARVRNVAPEAKYVLLTDADIALAPDTLSRLVSKAEHDNLALTSLMARLDARGCWGGLLIPAFIYFFQMLYPFPRVNDPNDSLAAAAGGCMLVRSDALNKAGGVEAIRNALIDDCALARRIKGLTPPTKIWLGLADRDAVSLRDNRDLHSIWNMVARTAYAQLHYSPLLLAGTVLAMMLIYLACPIIVLTLIWHSNFNGFIYASAAWALMAYTYWPTLKLYDRQPWEAALLPAAAAFYTVMTISSAVRHWRGKGGRWKGRIY